MIHPSRCAEDYPSNPAERALYGEKVEHLLADASIVVADVNSSQTAPMKASYSVVATIRWTICFTETVSLVTHMSRSRSELVKEQEDGRLRLEGDLQDAAWGNPEDARLIDYVFGDRVAFRMLANLEVFIAKGAEYECRRCDYHCDSMYDAVCFWDFPAGTVLEFETCLSYNHLRNALWVDDEHIGKQLEATGIPHAAGSLVFDYLMSRLRCDEQLLCVRGYDMLMG
jgi:hypothetical protein